MEETKKDQHTCKMLETGDDGRTNLCCCYILDADGNLQDPGSVFPSGESMLFNVKYGRSPERDSSPIGCTTP